MTASIVSASAPAPVPFAIARSMLSLGIEASLAFCTARPRAALPSTSPPPSLAATVIARASLVKSLPLRESTIAFLCLIDAHLECPDIPLRLARERPGMAAIPGHRALQALREADRRGPARQLAQTRRIHPLAVDLAVGRAAAAHVRCDVGARRPADELDDLAHRPRASRPRVERLAARAVAVEGARDGQVGGDRVLDVEEVALGAAV